MDRSDTSKVWTYDEVTTMTDPNNIHHVFTQPKVYLTNLKTENVDSDSEVSEWLILYVGIWADLTWLVGWCQDGVGGFFEGRRRLSAEDAFHKHIRTNKIAGFPRIRITEEIVKKHMEADRRLATQDDDELAQNYTEFIEANPDLEGDDTVVEAVGIIDVEMSTSYATVQIDRFYNGTAEKLINGSLSIQMNVTEDADDDNTTVTEVDFEAACTHISATIADDDDSTIVEEPVALFSGLDVDFVSGLIPWPKEGSSIAIPEFNNIDIIQRSQLKLQRDAHLSDENGRRLTPISRREQEKEDEMRRNMQELDDAFDALLSHIDVMQDGATEEAVQRRLAARPAKYKTKFNQLMTTINNNEWRLKEKAVEFVQDQAKDKVKAAVISRYGIDGSTDGVVQSTGPDGAVYLEFGAVKHKMSSWCISYRGEMQTFVDRLQSVVQNLAQKFHDAGTTILDGTGAMDDLNKALDLMEDLNKKLQPNVFMMSKIPYAGGVLAKFAKFYDTLVVKGVKPVNLHYTPVNNKVQSASDVVEVMMDVNIALAVALLEVIPKVKDVGEILPFVDAACPNVVGKYTTSMCYKLYIQFRDMNSKLRLVEDKLGIKVDIIDRQLSKVTVKATQFTSNPIWKTASFVLVKVKSGFTVMNGFLANTFTVCFPRFRWEDRTKSTTVSYPNGFNYCKGSWGIMYPCGTRYGYKTVYVSYQVYVRFYPDQCYVFSVRQLIDGAVSVAGIVSSALNKLMETAAKALGIEMPEFTIPGIPLPSELQSLLAKLDDLTESLATDPVVDGLKVLSSRMDEVLDDMAKLDCHAS
jgi:hypothetical protein